MAKDLKSSHRHKPEKLKPKDLNKIKKKTKKTTRKTRCANCKKIGHSSKECIEPNIVKPKIKKKRPALFTIEDMREMF